MPSSPNDPEVNAAVDRRALWVLLWAVTLALASILLPFYGSILWSAIIAMLFAPLNRRLLAWMNGRRTAAAAPSVGRAVAGRSVHCRAGAGHRAEHL